MIKGPRKILQRWIGQAEGKTAPRSSTERAFLENAITDARSERQRLQLQRRKAPRAAFLIAFTPRSGSSYLCDLMAHSERLGIPGEYLNPEFLPQLLQNFPAANPAEYLAHILKGRVGRNGVAGVKASWFQFANFLDLLEDEQCLAGLRYLSLRREDTVAQAISLYLAAGSQVFHTNVEHPPARLDALQHLTYSYAAIDEWHRHILVQEAGWDSFFAERGITPLKLTYEELDARPLLVLRKIARHLGVRPVGITLRSEGSVFRKLADERNRAWAQRFREESAGRGVSIASLTAST